MDAAHKGGKDDKSGHMSSAEKIKVIDTDGDGKLTAEEHAAGSRQMFSKMDTDGDGKLTAQEMKTGHEKMMSQAQ
jgi:Ca2+-binding EF-hand superfamily protein